jgi:hypothetical protein
MQKITELYNVIYTNILTNNPTCDYPELASKFIELSNLISDLPEDNDTWFFIGECNESNLMDTIIGAFWHYSQWHNGQDSLSYAAYSALGTIYSPNMECEPSDEEDDGYNAFEQLEQLAKINKIKVKITMQWDDMLNRGIMPLFELEMKCDEYLLVELEVVNNGIKFSFDNEHKNTAFDGEVVEINDCNFILPFDEYNDNLDNYLETILENINEGYFIPNDLYPID